MSFKIEVIQLVVINEDPDSSRVYTIQNNPDIITSKDIEQLQNLNSDNDDEKYKAWDYVSNLIDNKFKTNNLTSSRDLKDMKSFFNKYIIVDQFNWYAWE